MSDELSELVWTAVDGGREDARRAKRDLLARGIETRAALEVLRAGRPGLERYPAGSMEIGIPRGDGTSDPCYVEVPDLYDPSRPVPLLLGLHGIGGNGRDIRRALQDVARRRGVLVACPYAGRWGGRVPKPWLSGEDGVAIRTLRHLYRLFAIDPDRVWLFGVSLGGFGTWEIGLAHTDRFAALVTVAGGLSFLEYTGLEDPVARRKLANARDLPVLMAHGSDDDIVPVRFDRRTRDDLVELGYEVRYLEEDRRGHLPPPKEDLDRLVGELLDWLAERRRIPWPEEALRVAFRRDPGSGRWLRLDEADWTGGRALVRRRAPNRFEVEADGVRRLTLWLSSDVVDLARPVRVEVGARRLHDAVVAPDLGLLLDEARRRGEGRLVPEARLEIDLGE